MSRRGGVFLTVDFTRGELPYETDGDARSLA